MMENRKYNCSDVRMLVGSNSIAESFLANITELSVIRTNWSESYANDLKSRISLAITQDLGLDPKKVLRNATVEVNAIQEKALLDLAFLKTQLDVDFARTPSVRSEYLKTLGFTTYLARAQNRSHEALINLLQAFSQNLTSDIREAIVAKGTSSELLDRIVAYATPFVTSALAQEALKESSSELPASTVVKFNTIYTEVIDICKIAAKYYLRNPLKKAQFTFATVVKKIGAPTSKDNETSTTPSSSTGSVAQV